MKSVPWRAPQVDKLLQRIKLQEAGEMEPPPISLPDWVDEDAEDGGFDADALEDAARAGPLTDEELAGFFDGAPDDSMYCTMACGLWQV